MPCSMWLCARRSRWYWISDSNWRSRCFLRKNMAGLLFRGLENQRHGGGEPVPIRRFGLELLASQTRQRIEFCFAAGFGFAPLGLQPSALFEAVEGGIERPLLHLQDVARDLLDALRDAVPMRRFERHDFQDQHVEGALQQVGF